MDILLMVVFTLCSVMVTELKSEKETDLKQSSGSRQLIHKRHRLVIDEWTENGILVQDETTDPREGAV